MIVEDTELTTALRAAAPSLRVQTDPDVLASYRFDQARFVDAGFPALVAFPRSTPEVQALVQVAFQNGVAVVPRGAGSGLSGGANAIDGCIVLCLDSMSAIVEIDAANQLAVVESGVINAALKNKARSVGLHYPPDPASHEFSTIGGNIATNAGGLCCVKYGVTGEYVLGLEVVLGDGRVIRTGRRTRKGVAGYDLTRLFVGSEGTLGIITQATLRLRPAPGDAGTLVAAFSELDAAGAAIAEITTTLVPSLLELLDRETMRAIEAWKPVGLDTDAAASLIVQADGADADGVLEAAEELCRRSGADMTLRSSDPAEAALLLEARRLAFPSLERLGHVMLDDVAVPVGQIPALLRAISQIRDRHGVTVATFGHAGDGNMHPTIVFDANSPGSAEAARVTFDEIVEAAIRLGGTSTGEHGVGLLKRKHLRKEVGDDVLAVHRSIKDALDPRGILNPGKAF